MQQSSGISTRVVRGFINFIMNIKRYAGRLSYRRGMKLMKTATRENISLQMFAKFMTEKGSEIFRALKSIIEICKSDRESVETMGIAQMALFVAFLNNCVQNLIWISVSFHI